MLSKVYNWDPEDSIIDILYVINLWNCIWKFVPLFVQACLNYQAWIVLFYSINATSVFCFILQEKKMGKKRINVPQRLQQSDSTKTFLLRNSSLWRS